MSLPHNLVPASWDVGIFLLLWALGFFWSMSQGTRLLKTLVVAIYVSLAMVPTLSISRLLASVHYSTLVGYGVLCTIAFAVVAYILAKTVRPDTSRAWWKGLFLSALVAGFFIFYLFHQIPRDLFVVSPLALSALSGTWQIVFWATAPLLGLLVF